MYVPHNDNKSKRFIDLTGKPFEYFCVVKRVSNDKHGRSMWLCLCNCGKEFIASSQSLTHEHTKSCGCWRNKYSKKRPYEWAYNYIVRQAKRKRRPRLCYFSYEEFLEFVKIPHCHYCGTSIVWTKNQTKGLSMRYNLDRKDNSLDYTKENCVVCCPLCNYIKGRSLTYEEMMILSTSIAQIQEQRTKQKDKVCMLPQTPV